MMMSIWEKETFFAEQDVVIVGSGFVGLWSAFYLKKDNPALRVTIVDAGIIPTGASTRNAGFACFGSLTEVAAGIQEEGLDKTLELVEMRFKGLGKIRKHFGELAEFELVGGYELIHADAQDTIQEKANYLNSLLRSITKKKETYQLKNSLIGDFGFGNTNVLIENKSEGYLHSGKLVQALMHCVQGMGVNFFSNTRVLKINDDAPVGVETDQGFSLTTSRVLICTNAFTGSLLPEADIVPARGQVLLTSPIAGLPFKGSFHADEGYYYFRNFGDRVLLGGARNTAFAEEETLEMTTTDSLQRRLETYLAEVVLPGFDGRYNIDHRWSGIMAMGSEKTPIVREWRPGIYAAVRMSGMGVALAPVVARKVTKLMFA